MGLTCFLGDGRLGLGLGCMDEWVWTESGCAGKGVGIKVGGETALCGVVEVPTPF